MSSISFSLANDPSANTTMNFRFQEFDGEVSSIKGSFDTISSPSAVDASAVSVIYVKTEMMRKTFQFQTDAADVGDLANIINNDRDTNYYLFDACDNNVKGNANEGAWRWDISAGNTDAYSVLNPAHSMLDIIDKGYPQHRCSGQINYIKIADPTNRQQNLVKQDFIRHIAKELFGSVKLMTLFNNEDDLLANIELGGIEAWNNTIKPILDNSRFKRVSDGVTIYGRNNNSIDQSNNLTRDMILQLLKAVPKRFMLDEFENDPARGVQTASNHNLQYYIRETADIQPVPLMDGDTFVFTFKILGPTGQLDINGNQKNIPDRTYAVKICLVGDDPINGYTPMNVSPPSDVYTNLDVVDYQNGKNYTRDLSNTGLKEKYFIMGTETIDVTFEIGVDDNTITNSNITLATRANIQDSVSVTLHSRIVSQEIGYLTSDLPGTFTIDGSVYNYQRVVHSGNNTLVFYGVINKPTITNGTSKLDSYVIYRVNPLMEWTNVNE